MDEDAFQTLEDCIFSGDFTVCEAVPAGEPTGYLANPVGGVAVDMAGPARYVCMHATLKQGKGTGDLRLLLVTAPNCGIASLSLGFMLRDVGIPR